MLTECKVCKGKGYYIPEGWGFGFSCSTCHGKGGFDVPSNKELCPDCNGGGRVSVKTDLGFEIAVNCERCYGTGFIDKVTD